MQAHCFNTLVSFSAGALRSHVYPSVRSVQHISLYCSVKTLPPSHFLIYGRLCCSCIFLLSSLKSRHWLTNMSLTSARPIAKYWCDCWTVNAEYLVPSNMFYVFFLTCKCICWEFDYFMFKLNMLWWWWCSFLGFVHFSCWRRCGLCLIQSCL